MDEIYPYEIEPFMIEQKNEENIEDKIEKEQWLLLRKLQKEGHHRCIFVYQSYPIEVDWCKKEVCGGIPSKFQHMNIPH